MTTEERQVVEDLGGARRIHERLREYSKRVARMEGKKRELAKRHPDKWVALADDDLTVVADTLDAVLETLDRKGVSRADAVVEFLSSKPLNFILIG